MLKSWTSILAVAAFLAGCAGFGPSPQDTQAVRIEKTPGVAVVYLVRPKPDLSYLTAPVVVDDRMVGSTYAGTHLRLELAPGRHVISGFAQDNGAITLDVQADRVYFVRHSVSGSWRATSPHSFFSVMDEAQARAAMARGYRG